MRRVTMKTLYAGPERTVAAGATAEFEDAEAEALVTGGYGVYEGDTRPKPLAEVAEDEDARPSDKWTVDRLKQWATKHGIDLGGATKKADVLAAISAAPVPLQEMTVEELRAYADEQDISLPEDGDQAGLVAAIEAELTARE
ncbi:MULTISPECIES: Ish1 domain-containing protein [Streptomyces]|uniref:Ish1 domain-containing protein n=1 Tax=Streptomyces TaxID=1883 RepID=UPI00324CDDC4